MWKFVLSKVTNFESHVKLHVILHLSTVKLQTLQVIIKITNLACHFILQVILYCKSSYIASHFILQVILQGICLPSGNFFPLAFIWATAAGGMKPWTTETFLIKKNFHYFFLSFFSFSLFFDQKLLLTLLFHCKVVEKTACKNEIFDLKNEREIAWPEFRLFRRCDRPATHTRSLLPLQLWSIDQPSENISFLRKSQ